MKQENSIIKTRKHLLATLRKKRMHFKRQQFSHFRFEDSWRKPRGISSKIRLKEGPKLPEPDPGYRTPKIIRGLHPSGYEERYVACSKDIDNVNPKTQAIRFSGTLGKKKKTALLEKAAKAGIKVLNP